MIQCEQLLDRIPMQAFFPSFFLSEKVVVARHAAATGGWVRKT